MKMPFDSWAEPIHLENLSKKVARNWKRHFSSDCPSQVCTFSQWLKNSTSSSWCQRSDTWVSSLWSFESDFHSFGDNMETEGGWVLETEPCSHLVSRKWIAVLMVDSQISYHEIWTLGLMYSEACNWHLQKAWHPTPQSITVVRQRSILNDYLPDDKASYYWGVVSPCLKTHSDATEACQGEDKI
jgi:hypothetical protein